MVELSPPCWIEIGQNESRQARLEDTAMYVPGVWNTTDLAVTTTTLTNLSVAAGGCWVPVTSATGNGSFGCYNDAPKTITLPSAPAGNQVSLIVARVRSAQFGDASESFLLEAVTGTAGGGTPAQPANTLLLATATVNSGSTTVNTLTDGRIRSGLYDGMTTRDVRANLPAGALLRPGSRAFLDTDASTNFAAPAAYLYTGSTWVGQMQSGGWLSYTPTFTNTVSPTGTFFYRLIDPKTIAISANFTGGTTGGTTGTVGFSLPSGLASPNRIQRWGGNALGFAVGWQTAASGTTCFTATSYPATTALTTVGGFNAILEVA